MFQKIHLETSHINR